MVQTLESAKYIVVFSLTFQVVFGLLDIKLLPDVHFRSVQCVKSIVNQYFEDNYPIAITDPRNTSVSNTARTLSNIAVEPVSVSDVIIHELTCGTSRPGMVWYRRGGKLFDLVRTVPFDYPLNFIVVLSDYNGDLTSLLLELIEALTLYFQEKHLGNQGKVIVACPEIPTYYKKEFFNFLGHIVTDYKLYDVVVTIPSRKHIPHSGSGGVAKLVHEIYTWFPFKNPLQCGKFQKLTFLGLCKGERDGKFQYNGNLFPLKLPKTFSKCPFLYSRTFAESATSELEWSVLSMVFASLKVKIIDGENSKYRDISLFSSASSIVNNLKYVYKQNQPIQYIFASPHLFAEIRWYVPCPKRNVRHGNFHKVFTPSLWLLLFLTFVLSTLVTIAIENRNGSYKSMSYIALYIWAITTCVSVPKIPERNGIRLFFMLWVFYTFILGLIFQSFFTSFLIDPGVSNVISSLKELKNEGYTLLLDKIIGLVWLVDILDYKKGTVSEIGNTYNGSESPIEDFFKLEKSAVIATNWDMILRFERRLKYIRPCSFLHTSQANLLTYFNPTSVYHDAFNNKVLQHFEGGLIDKLLQNYTSLKFRLQNTTQIQIKFAMVQDEEYFVFTAQHLSVTFFIYMWGNGVSFLVFLGEIASYKLKNHLRCICSKFKLSQ